MIIVVADHTRESSVVFITSNRADALYIANQVESLGYKFDETHRCVTISEICANHPYTIDHIHKGGLIGDYGAICALIKQPDGSWQEAWFVPKNIVNQYKGIKEPAKSEVA